jgi:hypothetical protein
VSRETTGEEQERRASDGPGRTAGGKFAPGSSGNPAGRPKGSRDARTEFLDELLGGDGELIVSKLVAEAKDGRPWAVRLAIERLLPQRSPRRVKLAGLGRVDSAASLTVVVAQVIDRAAAGEITVDEAGAFLRLLEMQRRAIETEDLARRLELLEGLRDEDA